jgi:hypothetical protein
VCIRVFVCVCSFSLSLLSLSLSSLSLSLDECVVCNIQRVSPQPQLDQPAKLSLSLSSHPIPCMRVLAYLSTATHTLPFLITCSLCSSSSLHLSLSLSRSLSHKHLHSSLMETGVSRSTPTCTRSVSSTRTTLRRVRSASLIPLQASACTWVVNVLLMCRRLCTPHEIGVPSVKPCAPTHSSSNVLARMCTLACTMACFEVGVFFFLFLLPLLPLVSLCSCSLFLLVSSACVSSASCQCSSIFSWYYIVMGHCFFVSLLFCSLSHTLVAPQTPTPTHAHTLSLLHSLSFVLPSQTLTHSRTHSLTHSLRVPSPTLDHRRFLSGR